MPIVVNLDVMMAKRKMSLNELSAKVGVTLANTPRRCASPPWRPSAGPWTASPGICWSMCRNKKNQHSESGLWPLFSVRAVHKDSRACYTG